MRKRTLRKCLECGKAFYGNIDNLYCPECARKKKIESVVKIRVCKDCKTEFYGGPRASRCPECAKKAQQQTNRQFKKSGPKRPLGSTDFCQRCGKEYTVTGGRQKFCDECKREALLEWQRERKKKYNQKTKQNEKKKEQRALKKKICKYCLKEYYDSKPTNCCCDYCRSKQKEINQCEADIKRGQNRNLQKYLDYRNTYRENKTLQNKIKI